MCEWPSSAMIERSVRGGSAFRSSPPEMKARWKTTWLRADALGNHSRRSEVVAVKDVYAALRAGRQ